MQYDDSEALFFKRLSQLRLQKGVSARDMSLSLGQNGNYINLIENRHNFPSMSGFFYICEYFGVSPAEFFHAENQNPVKTAELLSSFQNLDEELLNHFISIANAITLNADKKEMKN